MCFASIHFQSSERPMSIPDVEKQSHLYSTQRSWNSNSGLSGTEMILLCQWAPQPPEERAVDQSRHNVLSLFKLELTTNFAWLFPSPCLLSKGQKRERGNELSSQMKYSFCFAPHKLETAATAFKFVAENSFSLGEGEWQSARWNPGVLVQHCLQCFSQDWL